ncbi:S26 family signal peptidase [Motilimonas eburnea]|uniref:S26 family signal peptidase n=1 Tax=Motilimonas eburnea TaxID=1737488 RepID=UPI001E417957|nr:S26 family signal peptidase [Motilimonas eburnea]MCE2571712.1 S26 family signal peptidase [Motilimonas eburnea]
MSQGNPHFNPMKRRIMIGGLIACTIYTFVGLFMWRYEVSLPMQKGEGCLEGKVWVIDTWDKHYEQGDILAFAFPIEGDRFFKQGQRFIKKVAAVAGEQYDITPDITVTTSRTGETRFFYSSVKPIAASIGRDLDSIVRHGVVPEGELLMLGDLPRSYDSRFWGTVPVSNIQGRAYAFF